MRSERDIANSPRTGAVGRLSVVTMARSRPARIIRAFARDGHVMHMALAQAGGGDAQEYRLVVEFRDIARANIPPPRAQPAGKLVQHRRGRALIGNLALDAFRHELEA